LDELDGSGSFHSRNAANASQRDAQLALELKDLAVRYKEGVTDLGPELQEMICRRIGPRSEASKDCCIEPPPPPASPRRSASRRPYRRPCACGCGAFVLCAHPEDASTKEIKCLRLLTQEGTLPAVNALSQRAYCEKLSRRPDKCGDLASKREAPMRSVDPVRLQQLALPREAKPAEEEASAPMQRKKQKMLTKAPSAPGDLMTGAVPEESQELAGTPPPSALLEPPPRLRPRPPRPCLRSVDYPGLQELQAHATKAALSMAGPTLPALGSDRRERVGNVCCRWGAPPPMGLAPMTESVQAPRRIGSCTDFLRQRAYIEERLAPKGKPRTGSKEELVSRLEALREENRMLRDDRLRREQLQKPQGRQISLSELQ